MMQTASVELGDTGRETNDGDRLMSFHHRRSGRCHKERFVAFFIFFTKGGLKFFFHFVNGFIFFWQIKYMLCEDYFF